MVMICMFFPAVIMCFVRHRLFKNEYRTLAGNLKHLAVEYAGGSITINLLLWIGILITNHERGSIVRKLTEYNVFAIKYLLAAILLAVALPVAEKYVRENVVFTFEKGKKIQVRIPEISERMKKMAVICFAIVMFVLHFIRIFDNNFWGDEGTAVRAARMAWDEMLKYVATCGHAPFYYVLLWVFYRIFGYSGPLCHLVSLLAYVFLLAATVTVVRKWFGNIAAAIFILLSSWLPYAVRYNVEVRMYSWCQMFILLAFLTVYQIFRKAKGDRVPFGYYFSMTFFSLGASYSHYFAMAAIGILYFSLLIYMIRGKMKEIWKVILSGSMVIAGLLPWVVFCYRTKGVVMTNYVLDKVGWRACIEFIFSSKYSMLLFVFYFVTLILAISRETGMLRIEKPDGEKTRVRLCTGVGNNASWMDSIWMITGTVAVLGTIAAAQILSDLFYPIIVLRYLYPCLCIMWLLMGVNISKCRLKKWYAVALAVLILISCFPQYVKTVRTERKDAKRVVNTLEASSEIDENSCIITDDSTVKWQSILYYPQASVQYITPLDFSEMDMEHDNWLFLKEPITDEITAQLEESNYDAELIVKNGYINAGGGLWIYRISEASQ